MMDPFRRVHFRDSDFDAEWLRGVAPMLAVTVGLAIRKVGE
jgi:type IV pilus assembly protein PilM